MPTGAALGAVRLWKSQNRFGASPAKQQSCQWLQCAGS